VVKVISKNGPYSFNPPRNIEHNGYTFTVFLARFGVKLLGLRRWILDLARTVSASGKAL
jgi:hypothetical protein